MIVMRLWSSHPLAFLLGTAIVAACPVLRPALADEPSDRIEQLFAAYDKPDAPGCAVAVLHRGKVIHQRSYGRAHLEWEAPITPLTVFPVASVSKQFTALALALLAEQGKLSLDDDVRKYLPELPDYGAAITLRHLLQHTSGLRDVWYLGGYAGWRPDDLVTDRDILDLAVRQKRVISRPGDRYAYNGTGYTLAGLVVRRVSGQSLRAFTEARVFRPLGMTNTHFHDNHREVVKNRAAAYSLGYGRPQIAVPTFATVGPTGLFTTVEDLARWDQNFYDRRVGGKSALDQMLTPGRLNSGAPLRYAEGQGYGLGLVLGRYRGLKTVGHSGIDWGYRAEYLQFPEQRFAVIILGNLDTLEPTALARRVADVCLAREFPEGPERDPGRGSRKAGPVSLSEREAAAWAGTYWNLDTGASWTFAVKNGKLCLGARELTPLAADRFGIGDSPIELVFTPATEETPRKLTWVDVDSEVFVALPRLGLTEAELGEYAGTYDSDELNAAYTLRIRDGRLAVRGWRDEYGPLQPVVADGFSLRPPSLPPAFVRFTRDGQKQVTGFTLSTSGCKDIGFVKRSRPL
jgi:CubicO group peptidase (beta-lactamase class C family)